MRHVRYPSPPPTADPDHRFHSLAPQLLLYPHLPANAVETILDALAAAGPKCRAAAFPAWPSPGHGAVPAS